MAQSAARIEALRERIPLVIWEPMRAVSLRVTFCGSFVLFVVVSFVCVCVTRFDSLHPLSHREVFCNGPRVLFHSTINRASSARLRCNPTTNRFCGKQHLNSARSNYSQSVCHSICSACGSGAAAACPHPACETALRLCVLWRPAHGSILSVAPLCARCGITHEASAASARSEAVRDPSFRNAGAAACITRVVCRLRCLLRRARELTVESDKRARNAIYCV